MTTGKHVLRAVFLGISSLLLVPTITAQCYTNDDGGQFCCAGTAQCLAHCVTITICDDSDSGYDNCSSSYGQCCDEQYTTYGVSGDPCGDGGHDRYFSRAVASKSGGNTFADIVLFPNTCSARRTAAANGKAQGTHFKIDDLR